MKVVIFRMLGLLLGLLIGLATAKEDKLTCESCKVNMRDFTLKVNQYNVLLIHAFTVENNFDL